jgi:rhodanese-related sulfurtransferase
MNMRIFFILILSIFAFSGCQTGASEKVGNTTVGAMQNEIKQISVGEAKAAASSTGAQFIDVRTTEEYVGGHAVSAAHFPLDTLESDLSKLDKNKPVYVICQTGRRSQKGSEILQKAGFKDIYNIQGGTAAWIEAGFPTEK